MDVGQGRFMGIGICGAECRSPGVKTPQILQKKPHWTPDMRWFNYYHPEWFILNRGHSARAQYYTVDELIIYTLIQMALLRET
jgi:hypothetical protein